MRCAQCAYCIEGGYWKGECPYHPKGRHIETPTPDPSVLVLGDWDWWCPVARETPANSEIQIIPLNPWVTLQIEDKDLNFLLDMGAAFSVLPFRLGILSPWLKWWWRQMENTKAKNLLSPSIVRWAIGKEPTSSYTSLVALLPYRGENFFANPRPEWLWES